MKTTTHVIDVGASRVLALAASQENGRGAIAGLGASAARISALGYETDFDATARAVRVALNQADHLALARGAPIIAPYGGPGISCRRVTGRVELAGASVDAAAATQVLNAAAALARPRGRDLLHVIPLGYRVDEGALIPDPRGLPGRVLEIEILAVTAPSAACGALRDCLEEAGAGPVTLVAAPYMSGLSCLTAEEREAGAAIIEIGAETLGVAAFRGGALAACETHSGGAAQITRAIAARFAAGFGAAERAKVMYAAFDVAGAEQARIARVGADGRPTVAQVSRSALMEAVAPALEPLLARAAQALSPRRIGFSFAHRQVVLTGGGAEIPGLASFAQHVLKAPVRIGRPLGFKELDAGAAGAALASAAGAIRWAEAGVPEARAAAVSRRKAALPLISPKQALGAFSWLRANL